MKKIVLFGLATLSLAAFGCGGTSGTDAGTPADTGTPPQDTGTPPQDTGTPPQDTGTPPQDTGTPPQDTGTPPQDTGTPPQDTGTPPTDGGSGGFMLLNDCADGMYEDRTGGAAMRVVTNVGSSSYTPRCMTISAGQSVTFMTSFGAHPLRPGLRGMSMAGSPMNPITPQDSGSMAMVAFPRPGFYPYYCDFHFGMVGVIRVR
ncbi:MAG: hypothetical protein HY909_16475 [Deltaproteobacteria bacterium]|nr:hypothetical protein [Deltaproteobacteria bacterium]